jgi:hypothetical protein
MPLSAARWTGDHECCPRHWQPTLPPQSAWHNSTAEAETATTIHAATASYHGKAVLHFLSVQILPCLATELINDRTDDYRSVGEHLQSAHAKTTAVS